MPGTNEMAAPAPAMPRQSRHSFIHGKRLLVVYRIVGQCGAAFGAWTGSTTTTCTSFRAGVVPDSFGILRRLLGSGRWNRLQVQLLIPSGRRGGLLRLILVIGVIVHILAAASRAGTCTGTAASGTAFGANVMHDGTGRCDSSGGGSGCQSPVRVVDHIDLGCFFGGRFFGLVGTGTQHQDSDQQGEQKFPVVHVEGMADFEG